MANFEAIWIVVWKPLAKVRKRKATYLFKSNDDYGANYVYLISPIKYS